MTTHHDDPLDAALVGWIATLSQADAVRRFRALAPEQRRELEDRSWVEVRQVFYSDEPYSDRIEGLARRFEVFAQESPGVPDEICLRTAHDLRHLDQWRIAERANNPVSERRLQALALASSCVADGPTEVRLRRIEEVLPQLKRLASEAEADGELDEQSAIGGDIAMLWQLRDALRDGDDDAFAS